MLLSVCLLVLSHMRISINILSQMFSLMLFQSWNGKYTTYQHFWNSLCSYHKPALKSASPTKLANILTKNESYLPKSRKGAAKTPEVPMANFEYIPQNQDPQNLCYLHPNLDVPKGPIMSIHLFASFGRSRLISTFGKCPLAHKTRCRELAPLLYKEQFHLKLYSHLRGKKATKKYATLDVISWKLCHLDNSEAGEQVTQKDCAVSI